MRISRMLACGVMLLALITIGAPLFSQTVEVGHCKILPSYPSIMQAVNAAVPGETIYVCPGTYSEQVVLTQAVSLRGATDPGKNLGAPVIAVPNGGLLANATSLATGNPIAAQVLVKNATGVVINGITVDGTNNGLSSCATDLVGILYQNSSGTITKTNVINEVLDHADSGCQAGLGIFVQSGNVGASTVTISGNHVENYQKNGITGNEAGTTVTITGNQVVGQGPTNGAAENSIQIAFGATGSISSNTVGGDVWAPDVFGDTGDAAAGLLVYASTGVKITSNSVQNTQYGIAIAGDPGNGSGDNNVVTKNTVIDTHLYDGIDLCGNGNSATLNTVVGSDESAVHIDDSCGTGANADTATGNTINNACAGILVGPTATSATTAPNTYYSASTLVLTGSNVCTPPLKPTRAGAKHPRFSAARP